MREYVVRGGLPGAGPDAAVAAGFASPGPAGRNAARSRSYELLHNPAVLKALREEMARRLNSGAVLGVKTLIDLCQNARSEQVRLSAANSLIDRGYAPVMSRNATVRAVVGVEDLLMMLDKAQEEKVIDGNFETGISPPK